MGNIFFIIFIIVLGVISLVAYRRNHKEDEGKIYFRNFMNSGISFPLLKRKSRVSR